MDILVQTTHAAGHSRFNDIEHAWFPLSLKLTGVRLPIILPGGLSPLCQQTTLSADQLREKEARVFDEALRMRLVFLTKLYG